MDRNTIGTTYLRVADCADDADDADDAVGVLPPPAVDEAPLDARVPPPGVVAAPPGAPAPAQPDANDTNEARTKALG